LIEKMNRIKGLVKLALKRQPRRIEKAQRAKRARHLIWDKKPREVDAAIIIQSVFRARRAQKRVHALRLIN
jgi:hypothetical protein